MTAIQDLLCLFGITRCYKGFRHTAYAIFLAVQDESRLEVVTKEIYMETASHFSCNWTAVERNIRTAAARAWKVNRPLLLEMAGYPLTCTPAASEFIEILASYLLRSSQPQPQLRPLGMP
ncbi:MAG TPA: sporulation initiation factor Spo0A C-terminal domain-containing protein [Candidatus Ruthenibacterium merdigallinarum]|nr:sporulation initiation factor Spo0A C-terminal domain-containing protein [Candidatus Ruthenibacterium merdigallinarum]